MLGKALLCLSTFHFYSVMGQGKCTDFRGQLVSHGLHYVPGPDTCTLCVCDNGHARVCKAVLCSPPQDCRSFRIGNTCCEFICLDDVVKPADGAEANVRVAAGGAAAVVLLTVALVVYRVRRQKRRRAPHADEQRSLTSIGYISGSLGYMGGTCETALAAWKPGGHYLPRGEAPPPYDEAVAQARAEPVGYLIRMSNEPPYHRTYSTAEGMPRPDDAVQCAGHGYANVPRPMQQMASTQGCYTAPLLQPAHAPEREAAPMPLTHHQIPHNVVGYPSAIRLTGSLGAISNRGLLSLLAREPEPERPQHVPGFYTHGTSPAPAPANVHTTLHRTIPRLSPALDTTALDGPLSVFSRGDRSLHGEVRRSFHRPAEARHDTGRSMPRNLNLAAGDATAQQQPNMATDNSNTRLCSGERSRARSEEQNVGGGTAGGVASGAAVPEVKCVAGKPPVAATDACASPRQTLPLTVDKPSCECSYSSAGAGAGAGGAAEDADADDYRAECENCQSASSSRWVLQEGWDGEAEDGTQTLQRRAPPPAPPPPATATLPQPVTKQPRTIIGPPSNWENWFNTIHDSDTESEEE